MFRVIGAVICVLCLLIFLINFYYIFIDPEFYEKKGKWRTTNRFVCFFIVFMIMSLGIGEYIHLFITNNIQVSYSTGGVMGLLISGIILFMFYKYLEQAKQIKYLENELDKEKSKHL